MTPTRVNDNRSGVLFCRPNVQSILDLSVGPLRRIAASTCEIYAKGSVDSLYFGGRPEARYGAIGAA